MTRREEAAFDRFVGNVIGYTLKFITMLCIAIGLIIHVPFLNDLWVNSLAIRIGAYIILGVYGISAIILWAYILVIHLDNKKH